MHQVSPLCCLLASLQCLDMFTLANSAFLPLWEIPFFSVTHTFYISQYASWEHGMRFSACHSLWTCLDFCHLNTLLMRQQSLWHRFSLSMLAQRVGTFSNFERIGCRLGMDLSTEAIASNSGLWHVDVMRLRGTLALGPSEITRGRQSL